MSGLYYRLQDEINARTEESGLSPIDLLDMPDTVAAVINRIIRNNGMKLEEIAGLLGQSSGDAKAVMDALVLKKYVRTVTVNNQLWYKAHFGRKADKKLSPGIWSLLGNIVEEKT